MECWLTEIHTTNSLNITSKVAHQIIIKQQANMSNQLRSSDKEVIEKLQRKINELRKWKGDASLLIMEKDQQIDMLKKSVKQARTSHGRNSVTKTTLSNLEMGNNDIISRWYHRHVFHRFPFLHHSEYMEYTPYDANTLCGRLDAELDHPPGASDEEREQFWFNSTLDLFNKKKIEIQANATQRIQQAFKGKYYVSLLRNHSAPQHTTDLVNIHVIFQRI